MRRLRVLSIVIFVLALSIFVLNKIRMSNDFDTKGPVITMDGDSIVISVNDDDTAVLSGVTAIDERDGDVSESLIIEGYSNFIEKGRRNVTIAAFDGNNHVTKVSREIVYSDYHSPRFSLSNALRFPLNTDDVFKYISANDVLDENITSKIKVVSGSTVNTDVAGFYELSFSVSNSAGDVSELPVTVEIYDASEEHDKPLISLTNYIVYVNTGEVIDPWSYVSAVSIGSSDYSRDEDVLRNPVDNTVLNERDFTIENPVDYSTAGVYEIVYSMTTEKLDVGSVRLIVVVE